MALAFDAAIRSFFSEAKTLKWSQKQNDCHYRDRYVNGTPHFSSQYSPRLEGAPFAHKHQRSGGRLLSIRVSTQIIKLRLLLTLW